jgi:hypothetical protein
MFPKFSPKIFIQNFQEISHLGIVANTKVLLLLSEYSMFPIKLLNGSISQMISEIQVKLWIKIEPIGERGKGKENDRASVIL